MKQIIHVNQQVIASNRKNGTDDPPLILRNYKERRNAYELVIKDAQGNVVAKVVNRMQDPLDCGARVWIETYAEVEVIADRALQGIVSDEPQP